MSNKPNWLRDAVATRVGWVNPRTNEILITTKGLPNALDFRKNKIVWPEKVEEPVVEITVEVAEEVTVEVAAIPAEIPATPEVSTSNTVVETPPTRKPGRPKKIV